MRVAVLTELVIIVVAGLLFLVDFLRDRHPDRAIAWHIAVFTASATAASGMLLLLALGVPVPAWVFVLVYAVQAGVVVQRLWLQVWPKVRRFAKRYSRKE